MSLLYGVCERTGSQPGGRVDPRLRDTDTGGGQDPALETLELHENDAKPARIGQAMFDSEGSDLALELVPVGRDVPLAVQWPIETECAVDRMLTLFQRVVIIEPPVKANDRRLEGPLFVNDLALDPTRNELHLDCPSHRRGACRSGMCRCPLSGSSPPGGTRRTSGESEGSTA
jgi:hypothetical protein